MTIEQNVATLKQRFGALTMVFLKAAVRACIPASGPPPMTMDDAKAHLQQLGANRTELMHAEADTLLSISDITHERTRLVLGCQHAVFGDGHPKIMAAIEDMQFSLQQGAAAEGLAKPLITDLRLLPGADAARVNVLATKLNAAGMERQRLVAAVEQDDTNAFRQIYQPLQDPLATYSANGQELAKAWLTLSAQSLDRIENTLTHVDAISAVIKPLFPEQASKLIGDQKTSLQDVFDIFERIIGPQQGYLTLAERYAKPAPRP